MLLFLAGLIIGAAITYGLMRRAVKFAWSELDNANFYVREYVRRNFVAAETSEYSDLETELREMNFS